MNQDSTVLPSYQVGWKKDRGRQAVVGSALHGFVIAVILFIMLTLPGYAGAQVDNIVDQGTPQDIYLLIGQSNMVGFAAFGSLDQATVPGAFLFNNHGWEQLGPVVHKYSSVIASPDTSRLGPGYTFARKVAAVTGRTIGVVANARGGTQVLWWQKGYTGANDFNLYEQAVERTRAALAMTPNARLAGIIWHQGEADNSSALASQYMSRLRQLMQDLRKDLNAPDATVIVGEVGSWGGKGAYINPIIHTVETGIENAYWISAAGLVPLPLQNGSPDMPNPHFNTLSQRVLGERYADKALEVIYGVTPGVATLYAGNELFDGLNFSGYSAVLPVGEYDAQALERHGIPVNKIGSIKVKPGYEVIFQTEAGPAVASKDMSSLKGMLVNGPIQAVSVQPSSLFAVANVANQNILIGINQQRYQVVLPFGTTKVPQLQVSTLEEILAPSLRGKHLSFEITRAENLSGTAVVRTLDETRATVHEATFAFTVTALPDVYITLGEAKFPSTKDTVTQISGGASLVVNTDGPVEFLKRTEVELVPFINGELARDMARMIYSNTKLPDQVTVDTLAFADGIYNLDVRIDTVFGPTYRSTNRIAVCNWDILNDDLLPTQVSGWFGTVKYMATVFETAGWRSATGDAELFSDDTSRLVRGQNTDEYLVWNAKDVERYYIDLFTGDPTNLDNTVEISVSSDMVTWQQVPYKVEALGANAVQYQYLRLRADAPLQENPSYVRVLLKATDGRADSIQLGSIELWTRTTE